MNAYCAYRNLDFGLKFSSRDSFEIQHKLNVRYLIYESHFIYILIHALVILPTLSNVYCMVGNIIQNLKIQEHDLNKMKYLCDKIAVEFILRNLYVGEHKKQHSAKDWDIHVT